MSLIAAFTAIFLTIGVAALRALIFQWLWGLIVVDIFGCSISLGFWASWGLLMMGSLLFNTIPSIKLKDDTK